MLSIVRLYKTFRGRISHAYEQRDLSMILAQANPSSNLVDQVRWLTDLMDWIRLPIEISRDNQKGSIQTARLKFLLQFLNRHPDLKANVTDTFQSTLIKIRPLDLFCQTGLSQEHGFIREFFDRLLSHFLPRHNDLTDLSVLFAHVFYLEDDVVWLSKIDDDTMNGIFNLLLADKGAIATVSAKMSDAMTDAMIILSARVWALAGHRELRQKLNMTSVVDSPFYKLNSFLMSSRKEIEKASLEADRFAQIMRTIVDAEEQLHNVYGELENSGVSIELVFKLESALLLLERLRSLLQLRFQVQVDSRRQIFEFVGELVKSQIYNDSVKELLSANLNLISKKIVERTGETGEHYIARTRKEYSQMFFSAGGGGALTVVTTLVKTVILKLNLPLFFEGLFATLNYALSFTLMQFVHFTLATKTPAMTASTLASKLHAIRGRESLDEFVEEAISLIRSGIIAAVANVGFVTAGAWIFDLSYLHFTGHHVYTEEYGIHQLLLHDPFTSLTVLYAILTGGVLWLGSIMGGWLENWFAYRRIPRAIEESRQLNIIFGTDGAKNISAWIRKNIAGIGTNFGLGFLLGFASVFGRFFGLPIDVRHVTLSSGALAFSLSGIANKQDNMTQILCAYFGILVIGILNLVVSFALSLFVAARARNIRLGQFPYLFRIIGREFIKRPQDFFYPPKKI